MSHSDMQQRTTRQQQTSHATRFEQAMGSPHAAPALRDEKIIQQNRPPRVQPNAATGVRSGNPHAHRVARNLPSAVAFYFGRLSKAISCWIDLKPSASVQPLSGRARQAHAGRGRCLQDHVKDEEEEMQEYGSLQSAC